VTGKQYDIFLIDRMVLYFIVFN